MRPHLLFLSLSLAGCLPTHADSSEPHGVEAPHGVRVARLSEGEPVWTLTLQGVTRAATRARLGIPLGGRLASRPVRVGDRVHRGDVLARLDPAPWKNGVAARVGQVTELRERLAQLDRELVRLSGLDRKGSVTAVERERVETERDAAAAALTALEAQLEENRRQLADSVLSAPFDGVVVAVHAEPGETLGAGTPVVELAGDGLEVAVEVPERAWVELTADTAARVRLPALGVEDAAMVVDLAGAGGGRGGLFPVVVAVPPGERRVSGLTAEVRFDLPLQAGLVAPLRSIVDPTGTDPAVFVVDGDRVSRRPVDLGPLQSDGVVVHGLTEGIEVVVAGHAQLLDGDAVEVIRD